MKVILTKDMDKLGKEGDVIEVKPGFARNYLIAKGLALESSASNVRTLEIQKKKKQNREKEDLKQAQEEASKIVNLSCIITVKAGAEGKLFGSVTPGDVCAALEKEGLNIDKKKIVLDEPIHNTGVYQITIKLHPEVTSSLKVWVVKE